MNVRIFKSQDHCDISNSNLDKLLFFLEINGHSFVHDDKESDMNIFTGCVMTDDLANKHIDDIKNIKGNILLYGCVASFLLEIQHLRANYNDHSLLDNIFKKDVSYSEACNIFNSETEQYSESAAIVISNGCTNNCSYCNIKLAKPVLVSDSIENILNRIDFFYSLNRKHIILLSDDIGSYGVDLGVNLPTLLDSIVNLYPDITLKLHAINPDKYLLFKECIHKYVFSGNITNIRMHVQSGSDKIIKLMNRNYKIEDLLYEWSKIKNNIFSASMFIINFPGETIDDLKETIEVAKFFNSVGFLPYYNNSKTEAYKLKQCTEEDLNYKLTYLKKIIFKNNLTNWELVNRDIANTSKRSYK